MIRILLLTVFIVLFGCGERKKTPIVVPEITASFYERALDEINEQISKSSESEKLIEQKLYYCERLGWPTSCYSALESYQADNGMTYQLAERYIAYYLRHERYQLLLALIEDWNEKFKLEEKFVEVYIECLAKLGKSQRTVVELREYLKKRRAPSDLAFASRQYLRIDNRPLAALTLSRLLNMDPTHSMAWEYGNLLLELGEVTKGLSVLNRYISGENVSVERQIQFARILQQQGRYVDARSVLDLNVQVKDSLAEFYSELFEALGQFDSAIFVLEVFIEEDSSRREPYWRLGLLNENRGRLSTAAGYYSKLIKRDPSDTLATQKLDEVQRKIAYLQRREREARQMPLLNLEPKKIENE